MLHDLLIGSVVILVPLGILIVTISLDLDLKEKQLSRRIEKLNMLTVGLTERKTNDPNSVLDALELDFQDKEQVTKLANKSNIVNWEKRDISGAPIENYALAADKVAAIRIKEGVLLRAKNRHFKIYAIFMYLLIWTSLGILPLIHYLGFNWHWK
jgi:hypothetical protein